MWKKKCCGLTDKPAEAAYAAPLQHTVQQTMSFGVSIQASVCLTGWHGCRGSALTDERPARQGGKWRTLPQGSTPLSTVICSTRLLRPELWLDCAGKEEKVLRRSGLSGRADEAFTCNISTNDAELTKSPLFSALHLHYKKTTPFLDSPIPQRTCSV